MKMKNRMSKSSKSIKKMYKFLQLEKNGGFISDFEVSIFLFLGEDKY